MRAKLHMDQAALTDYTAVIDMAGVAADLRSMALYNRALVYHTTGSEADAIDDLNKILDMADACGRVKTEARRKLLRMERALTRARTHANQSSESRSQGRIVARSMLKTDGINPGRHEGFRYGA